MILIRTESKSEREMIAGKHYMPFDSVHGFKNEDGSIMTAEQIEQFGVLVDDIPEPEYVEGKAAIGYINCVSKSIWYEYVDIQLSEPTEIELLKQQVQDLQIAMANMIGGA